MLRRASDYLRLCASMILEDAPRVAEVNKTDANGNPLGVPEPEDAPVSPAVEGDPAEQHRGGPGAPMKPGTPVEAPRQTAGPNIRAPRRQPAHARKWNPDTRRQKMREYMQQYRGTGRINERKPQAKS